MTLLSADDVLNRTFATTKFREGYDVEEVDDFLDLVLSTLRTLYAENDRLKSELAEAQAQTFVPPEPVNDLSGELASTNDALAAANAALAAAQEAEAAATARAQDAEARAAAAEAAAQEAPAPPAADSFGEDPAAAAGIIQLAQKLHDDHVRAGQEEGERLVAEAKLDSQRIVREAEDHAASTRAALETDRAGLETTINELKEFEKKYRSQLSDKLKGLLFELDQPTDA